MEVTSELMDSDDANVCQQLGLASADYKSKLTVCHRIHLDFFKIRVFELRLMFGLYKNK